MRVSSATVYVEAFDDTERIRRRLASAWLPFAIEWKEKMTTHGWWLYFCLAVDAVPLAHAHYTTHEQRWWWWTLNGNRWWEMSLSNSHSQLSNWIICMVLWKTQNQCIGLHSFGLIMIILIAAWRFAPWIDFFFFFNIQTEQLQLLRNKKPPEHNLMMELHNREISRPSAGKFGRNDFHFYFHFIYSISFSFRRLSSRN